MSTSTRPRGGSPIPAIALLAICTLVCGSVIGSIFHVHRSMAAEATCPICQLSHCVAVPVVPAALLPFPERVSGEVVLRLWSSERINPFLAPHLSRAPPAA